MPDSKRDLQADVGQLLVAGFDGHDLPAPVDEALRSGRLGGAILFARNVAEPVQVAALNAAIHATAGDGPLPFVSVDQEGGRVQRIREPATRIPPMSHVGATRNYDLAVEVGRVIGEELEALGFNLDFAPCADLLTNPENTVIGDRAFGDDPEHVARMAGAVALGLTMSGLVPCAKHFPGHGDTQLDSHFDLPRVDHDLDRLRAVEIEPFRRLIGGRIPMIMTAHILIPAIDESVPITLSRKGIGGILRQELDFGGVVVSDDLEMKAVADRFPVDEMVVEGVRAGVDLFLICHTREKWECAFEALVRAGEASGSDRELIALAAGRVRKLKRDYLRPWMRPDALDSMLGTAEHRATIARVPKPGP